MKAAIYARYSSENQRPESIEDQIASCRRLAAARGYSVEDEHIYTDVAASGAREDRAGLVSLRRAASERSFDVALVDDLSRLARNTLLLLSVLEELRFHGVRVVSVADGLAHKESPIVRLGAGLGTGDVHAAVRSTAGRADPSTERGAGALALATAAMEATSHACQPSRSPRVARTRHTLAPAALTILPTAGIHSKRARSRKYGNMGA